MALRQLTSSAGRSLCSSRQTTSCRTSSRVVRSFVRASRTLTRTDKVAIELTVEDGPRNELFVDAGRLGDHLKHMEPSTGDLATHYKKQHIADTLRGLSFGQTSVALLVAAGLGAAAADVGVPGALMMTGFLAKYLWPMQAAALLDIGKSAVKVVLALLWTNKMTQLKNLTPSAPIKPAIKFESHKISTTFGDKDTPVSFASRVSPKEFKNLLASHRNIALKPASWNPQPLHYSSSLFETPLKAPAAVLTPSASYQSHRVSPTVTLPPSGIMIRSESISRPKSHPLEIKSHPLAEPRVKAPSVSATLALAQPVGFRPMSIATVGLHLAHADTARPLDPSSKELKPAGRAGVMVSKPSADTYARKLAVQKEWEMSVGEGVSVAGSNGRVLPRVQVNSIAELLSNDWHEVTVFAATPMEWGAQGSKQVTWADLKLVAAYGIAA